MLVVIGCKQNPWNEPFFSSPKSDWRGLDTTWCCVTSVNTSRRFAPTQLQELPTEGIFSIRRLQVLHLYAAETTIKGCCKYPEQHRRLVTSFKMSYFMSADPPPHHIQFLAWRRSCKTLSWMVSPTQPRNNSNVTECQHPEQMDFYCPPIRSTDVASVFILGIF